MPGKRRLLLGHHVVGEVRVEERREGEVNVISVRNELPDFNVLDPGRYLLIEYRAPEFVYPDPPADLKR